jgi:hypothetical protein
MMMILGAIQIKYACMEKLSDIAAKSRARSAGRELKLECNHHDGTRYNARILIPEILFPAWRRAGANAVIIIVKMPLAH